MSSCNFLYCLWRVGVTPCYPCKVFRLCCLACAVCLPHAALGSPLALSAVCLQCFLWNHLPFALCVVSAPRNVFFFFYFLYCAALSEERRAPVYNTTNLSWCGCIIHEGDIRIHLRNSLTPLSPSFVYIMAEAITSSVLPNWRSVNQLCFIYINVYYNFSFPRIIFCRRKLRLDYESCLVNAAL